MKILKAFLFCIVMTLPSTFVLASEVCYDETLFTKLLDFNHRIEIDHEMGVEEHYFAEYEANGYIYSMKNSNDLLLAVEVGNYIKPIIYLEQAGNNITYKDINNRMPVISLQFEQSNNLVQLKKLSYFKENNSKSGLALSAGCMGGSTANCIIMAHEACYSDPICALTCLVTQPRCSLAIALACAISCNT